MASNNGTAKINRDPSAYSVARRGGKGGARPGTQARWAKFNELAEQAKRDGHASVIVSMPDDFPGDKVETLRQSLRQMAKANGRKVSIATTDVKDFYSVTMSDA